MWILGSKSEFSWNEVVRSERKGSEISALNIHLFSDAIGSLRPESNDEKKLLRLRIC